MTVRNLAAARLSERYSQLRDNGELGGSTRLFELQRLSVSCFKELAGQQRLAAFVVASLFHRLAEQFNDEAIPARDIVALLDGLHPYVSQVLQYMNSAPPGSGGNELLVALVDQVAS